MIFFIGYFAAVTCDKLRYETGIRSCTNCASVIQDANGKFEVKKGLYTKMLPLLIINNDIFDVLI